MIGPCRGRGPVMIATMDGPGGHGHILLMLRLLRHAERALVAPLAFWALALLAWLLA